MHILKTFFKFSQNTDLSNISKARYAEYPELNRQKLPKTYHQKSSYVTTQSTSSEQKTSSFWNFVQIQLRY